MKTASITRQHRQFTLAATALCLLPLLLQLPAAQALAIAGLGVGATWLSWRKPLPSWLRAMVTLALVGWLLAASGFAFGRDTGCAVLAAMLAIKPSETRSLRDARSLLGFALFAPFATFLLDQGPLSLGLGLAGVLLALLSLAKLSEFDSDLTQGDTRASIKSLGRMLWMGLPLVLLAFWLFPRLPAPLWGVPERSMARTGLSDEMSPGDWIDMMADDTPALRAQFEGAEPRTQDLYWRGPVLWEYDGRTWRTAPSLRMLPATAGVVQAGSVTWRYQLELEPTENRQIIALDVPLAAADGSVLNSEMGLYAPRSLTSISRWTLQASQPAAFEADLPAATRRMGLQLPPNSNPRSQALAAQWRAQHGADDQAIVDAAMQMIQAEFAYTLSTPLLGRDAVDEFLFEQKAGFCEHYAGAFVFLMRSAGIPARVVTGYAGGYRNRFGDYWLVLRSDAHAWAEVWLPQRGWVRVDPTAAVAPERIFDTIGDRRAAAGGALAALSGTFDFGDFLRRNWNDWLLGYDASRQQQLLRPLGIQDLNSGQLALMFVLSGLMALSLMLWLTLRQRSARDPLLLAWAQLGQRYARLNLSRKPHETADAWLQRVMHARADAPATAQLQRLTAQFVRLRYADSPSSASDRKQLTRALRQHRP